MNKHIVIFLIVGVIFIVGVYGVVIRSNNRSQGPAAVAISQSTAAAQEKAPDFTLQDLGGKSVSLSSFKGKGVILFFWTTWCPHCRGQMAVLNRDFQRMADAGIVLLAIDVGESKARVANFIGSNAPYPVLLDTMREASFDYGVVGVPTFIFISKQGTIITTMHQLPSNYLTYF